MKRYRCLINGRNFLIRVDGKTKKHGFDQNVVVEADSPKQAELLAIAMIRHNKELKEITLNTPKNQPLVHLETIWELDILDDVSDLDTSRALFLEKKWWQFWK